MRSEDDFRPQMGGDFRVMTMIKHAIRLQAHFTKAVGDSRFAPCSAHAAGGVDHWPLVEIQQVCIDQRLQGELRRRRVATRHGNQVRFFQRICVPLRQTIYCLFKQIRVLMGETIVFFIERGVVHTERTGEIEYHAAGRQKLWRQVVANFVGGG